MPPLILTDCQPDASGAGLECYWPALAEACSASARSPSGVGVVDEVAVDRLGVPLGFPLGNLGVPPGKLGVGEVARNRGWQATGVGTGTDIGLGSLLVGGTSDTKELMSLL